MARGCWTLLFDVLPLARRSGRWGMPFCRLPCWLLVAGNHASIHPRFQGQVEWLSLRGPVFEKPWAFLLSRRCASDASKIDQLAMPIPRWRCFLGISELNQKSIYTSESYIFNKNHLTLFLADSMSFIFKMLFFSRCPINIAPNLEEFLFSKPFRGFPFAKMRMGTEGFARLQRHSCRGRNPSSPKLTKRFQNGNWRLATRQMWAWFLNSVLCMYTLPKPNITMENQPFEDVSPIENVDFPMSC